MDAIADWVGEADPGGEAVPVVLPAFTDSRWFRAAFPDCVAYGFFPQRHQDLYESWPLMHSADERLDVRDLGFATEFFADLPRRLLDMTTARRGKLRLGGMALRNGLLVHGPTHWAAAVRTDAGEIKAASGRKPRLRAADGIPGVRGVARLGEAMAVIPLVKRGLPEAQAAVPGPVRARRRGGRVARRHAAAPARARRGGRGRRGRDLASSPRCSRCAAASWPPTTASSTRRSAPTRPTTTTPATRRRSTSAAARTSWRRCSPPTSPARCCCGAPSSGRARSPGGAVALASTAAAVEVFAWCERNAETRAARALKRPGFEIQRLVGTREPDERQLEVGRAALAEILRVEAPPA